MHLSRLNLIAYGHFTDVSLALTRGLNLIYGPNEAGKSTALRAINQLFFGFETRCDDGFLHGYGKLRVGATLVESDGDHLTVVRRKANKSSLRGEDDQTIIPDDRLAPWFRGIDAERYSQQFGIDYAQLVAGGRQIVAGGGDVGSALFAAASGVSNLLETRRKLQEQCEALYLPRGQKQSINSLLSQFKERVRAVDEAQLSVAEWERLDREIADLQRRLDELRRTETQCKIEQRRLTRLRQARPFLVARFELRERLRQMADVPLLPENFATRLNECLQQRERARATVQDRSAKIDELRQALTEFTVDDQLNSCADEIHELHGRVKQFRDALRDLPKRHADLRQVEQQMRDLLRELQDDRDLSAIPELQLSKARVTRVRKQADELGKLEVQTQKQREIAAKLRAAVDALRARLSGQTSPPDVLRLTELVERSQSRGDLDQKLAELISERQRVENAARSLLARLKLARLSLDEFVALPAPSLETLQRFEREFQDLQRQFESLDRRDREAVERLRQIAQDIERQRLAQDVPTEEELGAARQHRDSGWQLVRDIWQGRLAPDDPSAATFASDAGVSELADAFPLSVRKADEVADRMRREAQAVAHKAALLAERQRLELDAADRAQERAAANVRLETCRTSWRNAWNATGIEPDEPAEMRAWMTLRDDVLQRVEQLTALRHKEQLLQQEIRSLCEPLRSECQRLEPSQAATDDARQLARWTDIARTILKRVGVLSKAYDKLVEDLEREASALQHADADQAVCIQQLEAARVAWREPARELGLPDDATRQDVDAVIDAREKLLQLFKEATDLRRRISDIDACIVEFHRDARRLAETFTGLAADVEPTEALADQVSRFVPRLRENEKLQERRATLQSRLEQSLREKERADEQLAAAEALLDALSAEARNTPVQQLSELAEQSAAKRQLQSQLAATERQLSEVAAGTSIEELARDVDAITSDQLEEQLAAIERRSDELNQQRDQLSTELGQKTNEQSGMSGGDKAVQLQQDVEEALVRLRQDVETFAQYSLAVEVLDRAIERYRAANQDPLLKRAAELFQRLTLGRYVNIQTEEDAGKPRLVGIRASGDSSGTTESVNVEQMSEGTSDQLFLALRLAALERYFREHPPLPVVVDDILIKFDDQRAVAALQCLAELARSTQVVFFTHHRHVVELAESHLPRDVWSRQDIPVPRV